MQKPIHHVQFAGTVTMGTPSCPPVSVREKSSITGMRNTEILLFRQYRKFIIILVTILFPANEYHVKVLLLNGLVVKAEQGVLVRIVEQGIAGAGISRITKLHLDFEVFLEY